MPVQRPYNPNSKRIAEMIQSDWAKVGVKAKIVTGVGPVSGRAAQRRTAERAVRLGVGQRRSGQLRHPARLRGVQSGANVARWCDKDYDSLIQQAIQENQPQARAKLYQQAQVIFAKQAPWLPLATGSVLRHPQQPERLRGGCERQRLRQGQIELIPCAAASCGATRLIA